MEYKACAQGILLNLEFSCFVLSLKTNKQTNSPNQTRQAGVRVRAVHFPPARDFSCERTADFFTNTENVTSVCAPFCLWKG